MHFKIHSVQLLNISFWLWMAYITSQMMTEVFGSPCKQVPDIICSLLSISFPLFEWCVCMVGFFPPFVAMHTLFNIVLYHRHTETETYAISCCLCITLLYSFRNEKRFITQKNYIQLWHRSARGTICVQCTVCVQFQFEINDERNVCAQLITLTHNPRATISNNSESYRIALSFTVELRKQRAQLMKTLATTAHTLENENNSIRETPTKNNTPTNPIGMRISNKIRTIFMYLQS